MNHYTTYSEAEFHSGLRLLVATSYDVELDSTVVRVFCKACKRVLIQGHEHEPAIYRLAWFDKCSRSIKQHVEESPGCVACKMKQGQLTQPLSVDNPSTQH